MSEQLNGQYHGESRTLFWLMIKTSVLTLITLGIYRFWAKTRIRKYLWSGTSAGGDSFEYTGTGMEKFLGFLVAIVILAIYLGIVQMALLFFGLSMMADATTPAGDIAQVAAIYLSLIAVMPLLLFAQYRARRYKMARTRWRGIRFGMDSAAWGYVVRAIGHFLLTLITLGVLLPRQSFYLEKYMADRTWFGDAPFEQGGRWQSLYPGLKHVLFGSLFFVVGFAFMGFAGATETFRIMPLAITMAIIGYLWLFFGMIYYRIFALNYLTKNKIVDGNVTFDSQANASTIILTAISGFWTITGILIAALFVVSAVGASFGALMVPDFMGGSFDLGSSDAMPSAIAAVSFGIIGVVTYVAFLLALQALSFVFITQPIIAHVVYSVTLSGAEHLDAIQQRTADEGADAEGFADALDIGGAI